MKKYFELILLLVIRIIVAAGTLGLTLIITQNYEIKEVGSFFGAYTIIMGLSILSRFGLDTYTLRIIAKNSISLKNQKEIFSKIFITSLVVGLIILCLIIITCITFYKKNEIYYIIWFPYLPILLISLNSSYLKGVGLTKTGSFCEAGLASTISFLLILFIIEHITIFQAWIFYSICCWINLFISVIVLLFNNMYSKKYSDYTPSFSIYSESYFIATHSIFSYFSQWGALLLATLISEAMVAVLNAIFRMLVPLQFIVLSIDVYLSKKIVTSNLDRLFELRNLGLIINTFFCLPYSLLIIFFPENILTILYGKEYAQYSLELSLIIAVTMITIFLGPNGIILTMKSFDREVFIGGTYRTILFFTTLMIFSPVFGMIGSIVAYCISTLFQSSFYRLILDRRLTQGSVDS